jgi:cytochrome P450
MTVGEPMHVDIDQRVASFHHSNPDLSYSLFNQMRDKYPIAYSEMYGGFWVMSRYEDIRQALKQPDTFSSCMHGIPPIDERRLIPINYDPPEHGDYRNQFASYLAPARLKSVEARARARLRELLEAYLVAGGGDFISQVAVPYPCVTFLELLGLPAEDLGQLLEWKDRMVRDLHSGLAERVADVRENVQPKLYEYFQDRIVAREAESSPPDDLLTAITRATFRGRPFTLDEKTGTLDLFFEAGLDTVTGLLGFVMEFLATRPGHRRQLIAEPEVIPNAVEEFFRYFGIVTIDRKVVRETQLNGVTLHEGDYLMILTQAAGRDPSAYVDPEIVDFRRANIRHLGLGGGPHRCIGSHLARLELTIALQETLALMPDFVIACDPAALSRHWGVVAGLDALPLAVAKG